MELTQQHVFPHVVNVLLGVLVRARLSKAVLYRGQRCKVFNVSEHNLRPPVVALVVGLCGVGSTVKLKVKLAIPRYQLSAVCHLLLQAVKEIISRVTELETGE